MQRGVQFEDQVRRGFEERHGTILLPLCAESSEHPVLRASLDGLSDDGEPVELKVPTDKTYQRRGERGRTARWPISSPGFSSSISSTSPRRSRAGWSSIPVGAGAAALEFTIERDDDFLRDELIPACLKFWEHIQKQKPPQPDSSRDLYCPRRCGPDAVDGGGLGLPPARRGATGVGAETRRAQGQHGRTSGALRRAHG